MCRYLRGWVNWSDVIKLPSVPDTGFLLKYREYAAHYCKYDKKQRENLAKQYGNYGAAKEHHKHPLDYDD